MKSRVEKLRQEGEPLLRDVACSVPVKKFGADAGLSERQAREYRNENAPVMGCWHFLALCSVRPELREFVAKVLGYHPMDRQRRQLLDELAKIAANMMEEGDREQ